MMWKYRGGYLLIVVSVLWLGLVTANTDAVVSNDASVDIESNRTAPQSSVSPADLSLISDHIPNIPFRNGSRADLTIMSLDPPTIDADQIDDMFLLVGRAVSVTLPLAESGVGSVVYSLVGHLPQGLTFDGETRELSGIPQAVMLPETYIYRATDGNKAESDIAFSIEVRNFNEPFFPDTVSIDDMVFVKGEFMSSLVLPEATGGIPPLTYSFSEELPIGLSFDDSARVVSGTASGITTSRPFAYFATDAQGSRSNHLVFEIDIQTDAVPSFAGSYFPDLEFREGETITPVSLPRATGGNGELTYSLVGQPSGLMLDSASVAIIGTAEQAAPGTRVTFTATDIDGDQVSAGFLVTVTDPAPTPLAFQSKNIGDQVYVLHQAVPDRPLPMATGGSEAISYSLTPLLPVGLEFNASTRTITGKPVQLMAETSFEYIATAGVEADTATFSIAVRSTPLSVPSFRTATIDDQVFTVGEVVPPLLLPRASYGYGRLTYSLIPDLPEELTFDAGQRQITGTPAAEFPATEFNYTVTDASGTTKSLLFSIEVRVNTAPTFALSFIDTLQFVEGQQADPVILPEAVGGNGPLVYGITPELPRGLSFDASTRTIAGIPAMVAETSSYTYEVADADGDRDTLMMSLGVMAGVRLFALNSVPGQSVDMYLGSTRILDDLVNGSQGALVVGAGERILDIVDSNDEGERQPLLSIPVTLMPHQFYYLLLYHDGTQLRLAIKEVAEFPSPAGYANVFVAHGSVGVGSVSVRITDSRDHSMVLFSLASGLEPGSFSDFVAVGAAGHNVEIVSAADGSQIEVYRLNLSRQRNQVVALVLHSESGLVAINQEGQVMRPLVITAVDGDEELPDKPLELDGNYPNPFNPVTRIQFDLGESARVTLMVMDLLGRKVLTLPEQDFRAGANQGIEVAMGHLASGLYLYRIQATMESGVHHKTGRMTLSK